MDRITAGYLAVQNVLAAFNMQVTVKAGAYGSARLVFVDEETETEYEVDELERRALEHAGTYLSSDCGKQGTD